MKKVSIFGRSVPLFAVLIVGLLVTGASAAVVNYLSNTVTADGDVESPFELKIREIGHETWVDAVDFSTVYGGETLTIEYQLTNRANVPIHGDVQMEIFCDNGINASVPDFKKVELYRTVPAGYENFPIAFAVKQGSNNYRVLYTTNDASTFNWANEVTEGKIQFVVEDNAVGTYTISGKLVPSANFTAPTPANV